MPETQHWAPQPEAIRLEDGEVHLWRAFLDREEGALPQYEATLASEEMARANRFFSQQDRNHFIATRGILRELLSRYTDCPPADLVFKYGTQGKPSLLRVDLPRSVQFNVSHSHGLAVLAFAIDRAVGVDVELIRPEFAGDEIAERYFSPQELRELMALPPAMRAEGFFLCWTRKEAYVKGRGEGLHIPLDSFSVSLTPGQPARLESGDNSRWSMYSIRPGSQFVGAFVAEGTGVRPRYFYWNR